MPGWPPRSSRFCNNIITLDREIPMHPTNRRDFLKSSIALGAAAALPMTAWPAGKAQASDIIELGPSKVKVSRLAMGTGTFGGGRSSNQMRKLGADGVAGLWGGGFDNGLFFWDCVST